MIPKLHTPAAPAAPQKDKQADTGLLSAHNTLKTHGSYAHSSSPGPWVTLGSGLSHRLAHQGCAHLHHPCRCAKSVVTFLTLTQGEARCCLNLSSCWLLNTNVSLLSGYPFLFLLSKEAFISWLEKGHKPSMIFRGLLKHKQRAQSRTSGYVIFLWILFICSEIFAFADFYHSMLTKWKIKSRSSQCLPFRR